MKFLLIGKKSLLATIMVAQGFMGFDKTVASEHLANVDLNETGKVSSLGKDGLGNEVFCAVFKYPEIAAKISDEMKTLKESSGQELKVIPVLPNLGGVPLLIALSKIPGVGFWLEGLIGSSLQKHKPKLFQKGRVLRTLYVTGLKMVGPPAAAKPHS